jgi:4-hydroxy-4-methyl-2-oxoglutarate aldolase
METQQATPVLSPASFDAIRQLDTCLVSNAIERLHVRMRNEGSVSGTAVRCQFPAFQPMLGYAATGRLRSSAAPIYGRCYHENMSWWRYLASMPEPRIMVIQDVDENLGSGALVGKLHAAIGLGLNCIGCVTDGSVRNLPEVEALGFYLFSGSVSVTHQYAHVSEFGKPVEIGGCTIAPGDLIHGDRHGVHTIPLSIAAEIPQMAEQILAEERDLIESCSSRHFSLNALENKLENSPGGGGCRMPIS